MAAGGLGSPCHRRGQRVVIVDLLLVDARSTDFTTNRTIPTMHG